MSKAPRYAGNFPKAWEIVGRLTTFWARYESAIYGAFRRVISDGYDWDGSAMALAHGLRYGDMTATFARVMKARGKKITKEATACFNEIVKEAARVKAIRDVAAHRDFALVGKEDWRFEFKLWNRKTRDQPLLAYYWPDELEACAQYANRLASRVEGELIPLLFQREIQASESELRAWREIPSLPKPPAEDSRRTLLEYPLQPPTLER